jgi:hypothetical protein
MQGKKELPENHVFVKGDEANHTWSIECKCKPDMRVDANTGEIIWVHHLLPDSSILKGLIKL